MIRRAKEYAVYDDDGTFVGVVTRTVTGWDAYPPSTGKLGQTRTTAKLAGEMLVEYARQNP